MTNNARKPTMQATPTHLRHHSALCIEFMADDPSSARWHDWHATATRVVAALGGQLGPLGGAHVRQVHAVFGAGRSQSSHAEHALQCAVTLLAQAHEGSAAPVAIPIRIGLHSAPATAPAARMQEASACIARATPPGTLGLSVDSLAWLRRLCDVSAATPLHPGDESGALQACLLLHEHTQARGAMPEGGVQTQAPIGDIRPAATLLQAFAALHARQTAAAVTVVAEAGVGKSHLLRDFLARASRHAQPMHVLRAQAHAVSEHEAFGLLGQILRGYLKINADDAPALARAKLEQGIAPWFEREHGHALAQGHAHVLGHLIGIDASDSPHVAGMVGDPAQLRPRAFHVATRWLRLLSALGQAPLMLVVEDLHWADTATLEFLEHLLKTNADTALLIVASTRPLLATRRPTWLKAQGPHQPIELSALDDAASRALAAQLLRPLPQPPPALLTLIVSGAMGHPLCIEQRVQLLIDQGVIHAALERWRVDSTRLRRARLPGTLAAVVAARLALLPAPERLALQEASVMGPTIPAQLLGRHDAQAVGKEASEQALSFQHALLQELTYANVPKLTRRAWHGRMARWLVSLASAHIGGVLGQTAHHFEQAGDELLAVEYRVRAAEHATSRHAQGETLHHVQRGLALLDGLATTPLMPSADQALRWRLLLRRNHALRQTGQHALQAITLDALEALAHAMDDDGKRALAYERRTTYLLWRADYPGLKTAARQAMACAERAGDHRLRIGAMRQLAMAHRYLGDWDAAERLARQGVAQAREFGLPKAEGPHLNLLAMVAVHRQDPLARLRLHEQELLINRATGDQDNALVATANLGDAWVNLGELFEGRRFAEEALRLARAYGVRVTECGALLFLCNLERWVGNGSTALNLARDAVVAAQEAGMAGWEPDAWCRVGEAALDLGQTTAAAEAFNAAMALSLPRQADSQLDAAAGHARLALMQGDVAAAMRHMQPALDWETTHGARHEALDPRHVDLTCYLVLSSAGDARAQAWLQRLYRELMASAALISDAALRQGYLANIPDHRAILAAWALAQSDAVALTR